MICKIQIVIDSFEKLTLNNTFLKPIIWVLENCSHLTSINILINCWRFVSNSTSNRLRLWFSRVSYIIMYIKKKVIIQRRGLAVILQVPQQDYQQHHASHHELPLLNFEATYIYYESMMLIIEWFKIYVN